MKLHKINNEYWSDEINGNRYCVVHENNEWTICKNSNRLAICHTSSLKEARSLINSISETFLKKHELWY